MSNLHSRPPFRAEHLGSLLRPAALLDVKHKIDNGEKGLEKELNAIEDTSVKDIVKEQLDLGFHPVSDGEYRRHMFWLPPIDCCTISSC
jgi:methionine synthase II (cobalamin-independent)